MSQPSQFTQTSFNYLNIRDEHQLKSNLDRDLKMIFTGHGTLNGTAIKSPAFGSGFAINSGNVSVTGSLTAIVTGLAKVQNVTVGLNNGATATNLWVTCRVNPSDASKIDIYAWKPTGAADTTPIAATSAVTIHWIATGTAETTT